MRTLTKPLMCAVVGDLATPSQRRSASAPPLLRCSIPHLAVAHMARNLE